MAEETAKGAGLDGLLAVWSRRKWLAILAFVFPMSAAASLLAFLPNIYRSTATVLVDRQQVPETFVQPTVTSALETRLHTISQEILSRSRLDALINRFGLYVDLRKRVPSEEVIERMRRDIKLELKGVEVKGASQATVAFTISYQGGDPGTVSLVTNTLASFYIEENLKARERQATGTAEFLKVQLGETKKRLDEQEQRGSAFKRGYMGELPQQMETNLTTLERLHAQLRLNADNQTRAAERRQALPTQLAEAESLRPPPVVGPGGAGPPGGSEKESGPTKPGSRTCPGGSRSSRSSLVTTKVRASSISPSRSASKRPRSPRAWSSVRRGNSFASSTRQSRSRSRQRLIVSDCS